jgi:HD-GYP domain-containing protein (c-di-GMP phosphodiesterase class II)
MDLIRILTSAVDAVDPFTRGRTYRFTRFCRAVGRDLGLSEVELRDLEMAACLHDIGRSYAHHDRLRAGGRLDKTAKEVFRAHPAAGYELFRKIDALAGAVEMILAHHEQPDGKGYPRGLAGDEIPVGSRIIMAVAAFEAMTSDRPYRHGLSPSEACEELSRHAGTMFFRDVVESFIRLHGSGELFAGFEDEELKRYASGEYSSRAAEGFLASRGMKADEEAA